MVRVRLFGGASAFVADEAQALALSLPTWRLWSYLLLKRQRQLARKHVAAALWPDRPEQEALSCLRRQLHLLLKSLPPAITDRPWLLANRFSVQWNPDADFELDVAEFERRCDAFDACGVSGSFTGTSPRRAAGWTGFVDPATRRCPSRLPRCATPRGRWLTRKEI